MTVGWNRSFHLGLRRARLEGKEACMRRADGSSAWLLLSCPWRRSEREIVANERLGHLNDHSGFARKGFTENLENVILQSSLARFTLLLVK